MQTKDITLTALAAAALTVPATAQETPFQTPGMPRAGATGQTDRFSSEFNPALGLGQSTRSWTTGTEVRTRGWRTTASTSSRAHCFELNHERSFIDPNTWFGYAVIAYADEEEIELEEAAVQYIGFRLEHDPALRAASSWTSASRCRPTSTTCPTSDRPGRARASTWARSWAGTGACSSTTGSRWARAPPRSATPMGVFSRPWPAGTSTARRSTVGRKSEEGLEFADADSRDARRALLHRSPDAVHDRRGRPGGLPAGVSRAATPALLHLRGRRRAARSAEDLSNTVIWGLDADLRHGTRTTTAPAPRHLRGRVPDAHDGDIGGEVDGGLTEIMVVLDDERQRLLRLGRAYGFEPEATPRACSTASSSTPRRPLPRTARSPRTTRGT